MRGAASGTVAALAGLALAATIPGPARAVACTTPVYRVAMYDWPAAPYFFFHFQQGKRQDQGPSLSARIAEAAKAPTPANVTLRPVDVSSEDALKQIPEEVRKTWQERPDKAADAPFYALFTPWGEKLHAGPIDEAELGKMLDSPARRQMCDLLGQGHAAVLVLLTGAEAGKNALAEKAIRAAMAQAEAGKIPTADDFFNQGAPAGAAPPQPGTPQDEVKESPAPPKLQVATLTVRRDDPAEAWFVRMLVGTEEDLKDTDEPLVFLVYGRGRALPPLVGKGVTTENLVEGVAFLAAACSCTVKEQNPGFDLLTTCDWNAAAEAMAAKDPTLAGGMEPYYQELVPGGPAPEETAAPGRPVAAPGSMPGGDPAPGEPPQDLLRETSGLANKTSDRPVGAEAPAPVAPEHEAPGAPASTAPSSDSYAAAQTWGLAVGIGLAAIVVLVAGIVLVRRQ